MYEVCMSADRRVEPSFDSPQNNFNQNPTNYDNWDYQYSESQQSAPESIETLPFDDDTYSNTGSLLIKSGMVILLMLTLYVGHMIYQNSTHQTAELSQTDNQLLAAEQNGQKQVRKIDLTQTASVKKVKTISFKKPTNTAIKPVKQAPKAELTTNGEVKFHTVQPGDTISRIGRLYKVSAANIMEINNIENPRSIKPGMKIVVSQ